MHNDQSEQFFYELAARASDRMMEELPSEEELSRRLAFSPAFERNMEQFFAEPKPKAQSYRAWKTLAIAAAILVLLIAALMSVSAVRQAVFKFFTTIYEKYIVVMFVPEDETLTAPETILEYREPSYIPPGFEQTSKLKSEVSCRIQFTDTGGLKFAFRQDILDPIQYELDIESTEDKELFEMHGTTAMYTIKEGALTMIWTDNEYSYKIDGVIENEQALLMAQSVK